MSGENPPELPSFYSETTKTGGTPRPSSTVQRPSSTYQRSSRPSSTIQRSSNEDMEHVPGGLTPQVVTPGSQASTCVDRRWTYHDNVFNPSHMNPLPEASPEQRPIQTHIEMPRSGKMSRQSTETSRQIGESLAGPATTPNPAQGTPSQMPGPGANHWNATPTPVPNSGEPQLSHRSTDKDLRPWRTRYTGDNPQPQFLRSSTQRNREDFLFRADRDTDDLRDPYDDWDRYYSPHRSAPGPYRGHPDWWENRLKTSGPYRRVCFDRDVPDAYYFDRRRFRESSVFGTDYHPLRLPWAMWMSSNTKNREPFSFQSIHTLVLTILADFVATIGEFIGTTMFLYFAFAGTQVANIPSGNGGGNSTSGSSTGFSASSLLYISFAFGMSLLVNVWIFFRISGGLFNPAVTLAMLLTNAIPKARAACLVGAQLVGSIVASYLVKAMFPTALNVRTTLSEGVSVAQGLWIEVFLTAELVFTILMLAKEKHKATFIAPIGIGLALFISELVGVYYTGGSLNPARSFGPSVATGQFDPEHWIYCKYLVDSSLLHTALTNIGVAPALGSIFAVIFYKLIKVLEYEVANPGQDGDESASATVNLRASQASTLGGAKSERWSPKGEREK
ncbi:MAG: hypothetical protein M1834_007763 [Cirrosporium novae-zelandiae]|nr:MAG: hypothetical protein M1834_007763 [Cirrosporium novae-zelandiae]